MAGVAHQIALRLEGCFPWSKARIEKGRATEGWFWFGLARAIPADVHCAVAAERQLRSANGPQSDGAAGLAVYAHWPGPCGAIRSPSNIVDVGILRRACQVDHMHCAICSEGYLRLHSVLRDALDADSGSHHGNFSKKEPRAD